jgi:hypothetical protein
MYLYKYLCLLQHNKQLIYTECNNIISFSIFSIRKIKHQPYLMHQINNSSFFIYCSIFCNATLFIKYWKQFYFVLQSFFLGSLFGYYHGFRLLGRGYKAYVQLNNFVFRLGYSHNVYFMLPLLYKTVLKEKTKNFWMIKGTNNVSLSNLISFIRNFKIPNAYRFKGIYKLNDSYRIKLTKKGGAL